MSSPWTGLNGAVLYVRDGRLVLRARDNIQPRIEEADGSNPRDIIDQLNGDARYVRIGEVDFDELLPRDGSRPMTGPLQLVGAPANNLHAATKAYVDQLLVGVPVLIGVFNAATGQCRFTPASGLPDGPLPPAGPELAARYLITVEEGQPPPSVRGAPFITGFFDPPDEFFRVGDWLFCDGAAWLRLAIGGIGQLPEAPVNVNYYARHDANWAKIFGRQGNFFTVDGPDNLMVRRSDGQAAIMDVRSGTTLVQLTASPGSAQLLFQTGGNAPNQFLFTNPNFTDTGPFRWMIEVNPIHVAGSRTRGFSILKNYSTPPTHDDIALHIDQDDLHIELRDVHGERFTTRELVPIAPNELTSKAYVDGLLVSPPIEMLQRLERRIEQLEQRLATLTEES